MNGLLIQTILAAGNSEGEDTVWIWQMLVLVMVVASWGIYSLIKTRAKKFKDQQQDYPEDAGSPGTQRRWRWQIQPSRRDIARSKAVTQKPVTKIQEIRLHGPKPLEEVKSPSLIPAIKAHVDEPREFIGKPLKEMKDKPAKERGKDLHSGMELLGLDLVLSVIENTKGDDENDVAMRKLNFNELLRREQLNEADSNALKVYAINEGNLYGKDIQCEAMKELTGRTAHLESLRNSKVFPLDPQEWRDTDGDGIGDNADLDRDNDGWSDKEEKRAGTNPLDKLSFPKQ